MADGLIEVLAAEAFTIYGNDHHGHGRTAISRADFGDFGLGASTFWP